MRTITVDPGATDLAYGEGALWAANPLRGTLVRVKGSAIRTIDVGGYPRSVAVGEGGVWVATGSVEAAASDAGTGGGGSGEPPFPSGRVDRLVVADLPLQGGLRLSSQQMADAMAFVLRSHGFRAGRFGVALQVCDDAVAATRLPDRTTCVSNARAYAREN